MFGRAASQYMLRMPKQKAPTSRKVGASTSVARLRACELQAQGDEEALPPARRLLPTRRAGILTCGSSACGAFPVFVCALTCALRQLRLRNYNPHLAQRRSRVTKRTSGIMPRPPRLQWRGRGGLSPLFPANPRVRFRCVCQGAAALGWAHCAAPIGAARVRLTLAGWGCQWRGRLELLLRQRL